MSPRSPRRRIDPDAKPRGGRHGWSPATLATTRGEDTDVEREVGEIVNALREGGPMTRRELRRSVDSRFWGPGRFPDALWLARRRGLVRRDGGKFAAAD
jgi:hypothetical protein